VVLHRATHGFFLPETMRGAGDTDDSGTPRHPLLLFDADSSSTTNATSNAGAIRAGRCSDLDALGLDPALDLVMGSADSCPDVPNSLQTDADGDGVGDACDTADNVPALPPVALGGLVLALVAATRIWERPARR
jgi:hypothetical protein